MNLREREAMEANGTIPKMERTTRLPLYVSQSETEAQEAYKAAFNEGFAEGARGRKEKSRKRNHAPHGRHRGT